MVYELLFLTSTAFLKYSYFKHVKSYVLFSIVPFFESQKKFALIISKPVTSNYFTYLPIIL